ncbi:MAG: tetratricopeptide repeat protein [Minisyncoccota bacterium]
MRRPSLSGAVFAYGVAVMALPVLFSIFTTIGMGYAGGWVVPLSLGVTLTLCALALFNGRATIDFPKSILILAGFPLFLISCISLIGRQSFETMVFGISLEPGTVGSFFLFALSIALGAGISGRHALRLLDVFIASTAMGAGIMLWQVAISGWEYFALMQNTSLIVLAALMVSAMRTDATVGRARLIYGTGTVFLGILSLLSFDASGGLVATVILLLSTGAVLFLSKRRHIPWCTILLALFLGILLLVGVEGRFLPTSPEIRPSLSVTARIVGAQYFQDARGALLGSGPNTFNRAWEKHRLMELNASPLWELTPQSGYSTAVTLAVTVGALGFIAFVFVGIAFVVSVASRLRDTRSTDDVDTRLRALPVVAFVLFAILLMFSDVVETPLFLGAGIAIGVAARALEQKSRFVSFDFSARGSRIVAGFSAVLILAAAVWFVQISLRPIVAEGFHARAVALAVAEDPRALRLFERAAQVRNTPLYALDASRAFVERARTVGARGDIYNLRLSTETALSYAQGAIDADSDNYETRLYRGSLFTALIPTRYPKAAEAAYADLERAKVLAPMRPDILYQEAVLELSLGRKVSARIALEKALELKSDYTEALSLLKSLSEY